MSKWVMHHPTQFDPIFAVKGEQIRDIVLGAGQVLCVEKISRNRQQVCNLPGDEFRRVVANIVGTKVAGLVDPTNGAGVVAERKNEFLGFPSCVALINRQPYGDCHPEKLENVINKGFAVDDAFFVNLQPPSLPCTCESAEAYRT